MISPKALRVAVGETRASYPVPALAGTGCGSGLVILIIAAVAWMVRFTLTEHPELLRTERTTIVGQALQIYGNDKIGDLDKGRIERTINTYLQTDQADAEGPVTRKKALPPRMDRQESDDE